MVMAKKNKIPLLKLYAEEEKRADAAGFGSIYQNR